MKGLVTLEDYQQRLSNLEDIWKEVKKEKKNVKEVMIEKAGFTEKGVEWDFSLAEGYIKGQILSEEFNVVNMPCPGGNGAVSIPYDVPQFLTFFYCSPIYLSQIDLLEVHFASTVKDIAVIFDSSIQSKGIKDISINLKQRGKEFGEKCVADPECKHFVIAGGQGILDYYKKYSKSFSTCTVFGPTRPKAIIVDEIPEKFYKDIIKGAFFNTGQLCGLIREVHVISDVYDVAKENLRDY